MRLGKITFIWWYILLIAFIGISLFCLIGCRSTSTIEKEKEISRVYQLTDMMDSLLKSTSRIQQDIYERQTSFVDSIRQMERNDSSHTATVNEKGDTVKEVIRIMRIIERERNTESKESEVVVHLQSMVDSLIRLSVENKEMTDSLLKSHEKETVVEKQPTLWQKVKQKVGGYAMILFIILVIYVSIWSRRRRMNTF